MNNTVADKSMHSSSLRSDEMSRYHIDSPSPNPRLSFLAELASNIAEADVGGISLVYDNFVSIVSASNYPIRRFDRMESLCARAVEAQKDFFEIADLHDIAPCATRHFPGMRHYAATTLFSKRGYILGTLWTMSKTAGILNRSQQFLLSGISRLVVDALELHYCNPITKMQNRANLMLRAKEIVASNQSSAILIGYLNLIGFHRVNKLFGRDIGDRFLTQVGKRLQGWTTDDTLVGHLEADRFGFIIYGPSIAERLSQLQQLIDTNIQLPDGRLHKICARVGVVKDVLPTRQNVGALFDMAETASGMIGTTHGFTVIREYTNVQCQQSRTFQAFIDLLAGIPEAGELSVHYQPQVNFADERLIGFEALARWMHPEHGMIPPQVFVKLAEDGGHCYELDMRIAQLVCKTVRRWIDVGLPVVPVSLNMSRASLANPRFPHDIAQLLITNSLPGDVLEVEITEGHLLDSPDTLHRCIDALKELKIRIAIDDFGIGYSNLDTIAKLKFDRLKVDRRFVHGVSENENTASLFLLIQGVAKVCGAQLLSEGLERKLDLEWLRRHKAYFVQGWYFGKALPLSQTEQLLQNLIRNSKFLPA